MSEPKETTSNRDPEQYIGELNELGAKIQPGGVVELAIKKLGMRVKTVEGSDTLIQETPKGYEAISPQGTHYDKEGNVTLQGSEEEKNK